MAPSPAALPRLLAVATLCLLSAPNTLVLRVDAQPRDCSDVSQACNESDFCSACLASTSEPAYSDCQWDVPADGTLCDTEQSVCCYNEASGNDCVGDPVTHAYLECFWDPTDSCEDDWTCSGSFTAAPTPAPSELTVSASMAPTASGDSEDTDTTSGGSGQFSTVSVGRVATGLLAFGAAAAAVVV
ncbi:unnamed protein product [Ectocarpus sp. 12 AP-2014]